MAAPTRTHYEILGIARDADAAEVRRAWKVLVQVWHPDRFSGDMRLEAERAAADINAAYHALRDQSRRAAYDCTLAAEDAKGAAAAAVKARAASTPARRAAPSYGGTARTSSFQPAAAAAAAAAAAPPITMVDVAARASQDIIDTVRRSPRAMGITAAAMLALVLGSLLFGSLTGPSLPAGGAAAHAEGLPSTARAQDMPSLETLVEDADVAIGPTIPDSAPDGGAIGPGGLSQSKVLAAPVERAEPAPKAPRIVHTRKNGKRVLRVLPAL